MTSTLQISPEIYQILLAEKISEAANDVLQFISTQQYDQALKLCHQILDRAVLAVLNNPEQQQFSLFSLIVDEYIVFQPLTKLPRQEQDRWIEWLLKVQQYALNLGVNTFAVSHLKQLVEAYQTLGRTDLAAIALQQATETIQQIPDVGSRADELIQLAWLRFQQKLEVQAGLTLALTAVEQLPSDYYARGNHLESIAFLYTRSGAARRALAIAETIGNEYHENSIYQEVVRDAIAREDLHLAQAVTAKIHSSESQAFALVDMAVYWATHDQPRLGNRLFAKALKLVAKEQYAAGLQARLIQTYCTTSQLTIALNAAQRLAEEGAKITALTAIAVAYAKANQSQQVQQVLAQLTDLIHSKPAIEVGPYLGYILQSAIDAQQYNLAIAVLNVVKNNTEFYDLPSWYRRIVEELLRSQNLDKALEVAKEIPHHIWPEERNLSLKEIALAYANTKQWHQAIEVVKQIDNTVTTPYQVLTRVELAANAPTQELFTSLIQIAIAQAQALEIIEQKALALAAIAQAYLRLKDAAQTQSFLQQAIQTVQQVKDEVNRGLLFRQIVDYFIQHRQYTAALTIAQANSDSQRQESYDVIFQQALPNYVFDAALQVVEVETLPDRQATKLLAIAKTYAQLGRNEDAIVLLDRAFALAQQIADPETRIIQVNEYMQVADENDRAHQYTRLVKQYVALDRLNKAQQVVEKVQVASLRDYLQAWIDC
ncbi:hypothetical protein [Calothrix sp. NIES-2098]|uniref:hypothetical protein n=1 Tax=Calothrix sp. NIES-2098 TaxID=1954171 RepID=UPI000B61BC6E|nr:hypothetical protein NIES2098_37430 [Calothrix sp. NIES-2098]